MPEIALLAAAYLLGSISFAVVVSKLFELPDPRSYGSGNPGATNVLRTGRRSAAALTLVGDAAKGWLAVWLAEAFLPAGDARAWWLAAVGLVVFLGHLYPLFFGFKGGKGVATALGVLLAVSPWLAAACAATWLIVFAMFRISSLAALAASLLAPLYAAILVPAPFVALATVLAVLLVWRHRANIGKLLRGEETGFGRPRPQDAPPE